MKETQTVTGLPMLKPMSKRRMIKKFTKYTASRCRDTHKKNIEAQEHIQAVMSYAAKYRAGMKPKQSRIFVKNSIAVFRDIIRGRFDGKHENTDAEFFREWTRNCRGEDWFKYCLQNLKKSPEFYAKETKPKYAFERDLIETEITPFSRLNSFGTPLQAVVCFSDDLKHNERALQKGDTLNCYFIDPKKIEHGKPYLFEYKDDKGEIWQFIRVVKIEGRTIHLICQNPDCDESQNLQFTPSQYLQIFTGVALIHSFGRNL